MKLLSTSSVSKSKPSKQQQESSKKQLQLSLKMEAVHSSVKLIQFYPTTRRYIRSHSILHSQLCENLKYKSAEPISIFTT
jgi:hypothetical protein